MLVDTRTGYLVSTFSDLKKANKKTFLKFVPHVRHVLIILIIILSSITLAEPQKSYSKQNISKKGIDIVLALDVSDSMRAEDLEPNRMEVAKKALERFIDTRESDRVGIVIFAGIPFTQSPLTFDYDILKYFVENISTKSVKQGAFGAGGTAIGDAVLAGLNRLKDSGDREKIIILISDGDANVGIDPIVAAAKAKEEDVRIYTIGIGKKGGAGIPITDAYGRKTYARNRDGSIYMATFNEDSLRAMAEVTGGLFFRADDETKFNQALDDIDSLDKREITVSTQTEYSDAFAIWLYLLGVVFSLFVLFEGVYKAQR